VKAAKDDQELYQKIKSGDYYKDALEWYNSIYIYPVVHRTFLIVLTIFCLLTTIFGLYSIYDLMPLVKRIPVIAEVPNLGELYTTLNKIDVRNEDPTQGVAIYLLGEYVAIRESYKYESLERNASFVKQLSSPALYNNYMNYMDIRNAASPVGRLKEHGSIEVRNISVNLPVPEKPKTPAENNNKSRQAAVFFELQEISNAGVTVNKYRADILFSMSEITFDKTTKTFTPLDFQVENYIVTPLNTEKPAPAKQS